MQYIVLFFQQKISFTNNFTSINIKKAPEVNRTLLFTALLVAEISILCKQIKIGPEKE